MSVSNIIIYYRDIYLITDYIDNGQYVYTCIALSY